MAHLDWHQIWKDGDVRFHRTKVSPYLTDYYTKLRIMPGDQVFLPLCGKSVDMLWLADRGHPVLGVELSSIAARSFFQESQIDPTIDVLEPFSRWHGSGIEILVGDFFDLNPADLQFVRAAHDSAALVALPARVREKYAAHTIEIMPVRSSVLLTTCEYPEADLQGPPYSVSEAEIRELYSQGFSVEQLTQYQIEDPKWLARYGISACTQAAYLLQRVPT